MVGTMLPETYFKGGSIVSNSTGVSNPNLFQNDGMRKTTDQTLQCKRKYVETGL